MQILPSSTSLLIDYTNFYLSKVTMEAEIQSLDRGFSLFHG